MASKIEDPAVVAGKEAAEAKAAWLALPHSTPEEEATPGFEAAEKRWHKADVDFADAPVTSVAGALAKVRALVELIEEDTPSGEKPSWEAGHVYTLSTFLEGFTGAPSVVADDPAVVALAEFRKAKVAEEAFPDDVAAKEPPEYLAAGDRRFAAGDAVLDAVPTSLAGVGAKIRYVFDHQERGNDLWPAFDAMAKSMLPFLEGAPVPPPRSLIPSSACRDKPRWARPRGGSGDP